MTPKKKTSKSNKRRSSNELQLSTGKKLKALKVPSRRATKLRAKKPIISSKALSKLLKKSKGAGALFIAHPHLEKAGYEMIASFSPCQKTGTARYLDLWDVDHFDDFTDMQENLSNCRVWFSDKGYTSWGSAETSTGRINCYFRAPTAGDYVCTVELQSHSSGASVECLLDSMSFGLLGFTGSVAQPHHSWLDPGYHHFRIRQVSGAFFFSSLTVWKAI